MKLQKSAVDLTDLAIGIVVLGIIVTIGATVLVNVRDTNYELSATCNETSGVYTGCPGYEVANDAATGLAEYGNWFNIIVIVGVAAVVLSLIFLAFGGRSGANY